MFRRIHIPDIGGVIDASLAWDSLSDADISAAIDVETGRTSQGRVVVAGDVEKKRVNSDSRVVVAFGCAGEGTNTGGGVSVAAGVQIECPEPVGSV